MSYPVGMKPYERRPAPHMAPRIAPRGSRFDRANCWITIDQVKSAGVWVANIETANNPEVKGLRRRIVGRQSHLTSHGLLSVALISASRQLTKKILEPFGPKPTLIIRSSHPSYLRALRAALDSGTHHGEQLRIGQNLLRPLAKTLAQFSIVELISEPSTELTDSVKRQASQQVKIALIAERMFTPTFASE